MNHQFCVPCLFGLEGLAADELRRMNAEQVAAENGRVYFSEFTFYSDSGFERFHPDEWDEKLGALIRLPEEKTT